ncbi:MAG: hydroxymethylglutaryl-CoA reductase, degradative [Candidatus Micrarchaeia archaeon]
MNSFSGFYKKSVKERILVLKSKYKLSDEEITMLENSGALDLNVADRMIENVIGAVHLPLGIATNFVINGKETIIPMALEEPSVIAAASNAAKLSLPEGFISIAQEPVMIGQIQIVDIKDAKKAIEIFNKNKKEIFDYAKQFALDMEKYGGGLVDVSIRKLDTIRGKMLICEASINVCDAMGANTINTVLEKLSPYLANLLGGKIRLRILTNLAVKRKVKASAIWKKEAIGEDAIEGILDGYAFAKSDIYRCATNNKGIMNGMDSIAIATGNDWRAVEAGAHAYASIEGYKPLASYTKTEKGDILGEIELPLSVGTVGGAINTLPQTKTMFKIMGIKSSGELSMIMACVGLANNFAALKALSTEGIQKGHMGLHARNICVMAGAKTPKEIDKLTEILARENNFSLGFAKQKLGEMRR